MSHDRRAAALIAVLLVAGPALAQDGGGAGSSDDGSSSGYRWALYTSCTVVFALIAVFLTITRRRAAAVAEDVAAIERRLDELERGGRPR